ncbi:hypothetical protein PoB_005960900 [Plakobranchus ocellatus]|uniref:Uncharacterized protein n=1 Tax=Plakobranchus ocellatus TaxID=259542 RepID=A0AAV4CNC6_9GAST|nr:hypothetical protein PoB_005960900 [Plakobranchus ocellatus]
MIGSIDRMAGEIDKHDQSEVFTTPPAETSLALTRRAGHLCLAQGEPRSLRSASSRGHTGFLVSNLTEATGCEVTLFTKNLITDRANLVVFILLENTIEHAHDSRSDVFRNVDGTVASECALRSAETPLPRIRAQPPAPWPDEGLKA